MVMVNNDWSSILMVLVMVMVMKNKHLLTNWRTNLSSLTKKGRVIMMKSFQGFTNKPSVPNVILLRKLKRAWWCQFDTAPLKWSSHITSTAIAGSSLPVATLLNGLKNKALTGEHGGPSKSRSVVWSAGKLRLFDPTMMPRQLIPCTASVSANQHRNTLPKERTRNEASRREGWIEPIATPIKPSCWTHHQAIIGNPCTNEPMAVATTCPAWPKVDGPASLWPVGVGQGTQVNGYNKNPQKTCSCAKDLREVLVLVVDSNDQWWSILI